VLFVIGYRARTLERARRAEPLGAGVRGDHAVRKRPALLVACFCDFRRTSKGDRALAEPRSPAISRNSDFRVADWSFMATRSTLDPKQDVVFWMLFALERNRPLLMSLLTAVLQPASPISSVELLDPDLDVFAVDDKGVVLDLRVALSGGDQVDIEMQSRPHPALPERLLYYWSKLYAGQLERGGDYTELRPSIAVMFANFSLDANSDFHSVFQIRERLRRRLLTQHFELHVVELPRASDRSARDEPLLELWCRFLSATTDAQLETLARQDLIMTQAKAALEELSADPRARERAELRKMSEMAYWTAVNVARREGETLGRAEGEALGRAEGEALGRAEGEALGRLSAKVEALSRVLGTKFGELAESARQRLRHADEATLDRWFEAALHANQLDDVWKDDPNS
jgi:predicted transposase/invertase (TIGR01784 family)